MFNLAAGHGSRVSSGCRSRILTICQQHGLPMVPLSPDDACVAAAELIADADGLVITAGAGIGIDSGLPDFRGDRGFWNAYPGLGARGMRFVDVANPKAFASMPEVAWGFYGHRLALYRQTVPHAGFGMLLRMAA